MDTIINPNRLSALVSHFSMSNFTKITLFLLLFGPRWGYAEPQPLGPYGFGKGLNLASVVTQLDSEESPDLCNCITEESGSTSKRFGSKRLVEQAFSSYPVTSLYRAYSSTGSKKLIATMRDAVVYSTSDTNPQWIVASTGLSPYQNWSWVTMNNKAIGAGSANANPLKSFDINTGSITNLIPNQSSSETIVVRGKYILSSKNYLLVANVVVSTGAEYLVTQSTAYPSRVYYTILNQISSFTLTRFIEYRTDDGEVITGLGNVQNVHIFKQSSIAELSFSILNLRTIDGDQSLSEIVSGFGLYAPRTLASNGQFYIMASKDGIRLWDPRDRLTSAEENIPISKKIKPLLDKLIKAGTYEKMVGKWYPKNQWYILSYEDPDKFPRGRNNSVIIYDYKIGEWFPFCGWLAESFETQDGAGDKGELLYGDANDSYVYIVDQKIRIDDAPKQIVVDSMDNQAGWTGSTQDTNAVKEGTASLKIITSATVLESSMTKMAVFPVGEWYDKTKISRSDKLSFKVNVASMQHVSSLRVDLEVNDIDEAFDANFTSVTFTSATLTGQSTTWITVEFPISSFPIRTDWTSLETEGVPFANTLTFYGLRFVLNAVNMSTASIDDVRIIQATDNPVKFYRYTKFSDFGTLAEKTYGQALVTMEKSPEASLSVDIYDNFTGKTNTKRVEADISKEIVVLGFVSTASIAVLDSNDFSVKRSTSVTESEYLPLNGVKDKKYIYFSDRTNDRLMKMSLTNFSTFTTIYGAFGSGTTNQNIAHQIDIDNQYIDFVDMGNQRIKRHSASDLSFARTVGGLSRATTGFHQPTGICKDDKNVYVADEGNYRWIKFNYSTFGYILDVPIDYNTIGDTSLECDERYVYGAYNKISDASVDFQDVVLESRDKGDLSLINRIRVLPENDVSNSTYTIMGDIALLGRYIFIPFSVDYGDSNQRFYLQKRLKSDFSLVREYSSNSKFFSVIGDGQAHIPTTKIETVDLETESKYIQLKFYDDSLDNSVKLINYTILAGPHGQTY